MGEGNSDRRAETVTSTIGRENLGPVTRGNGVDSADSLRRMRDL
jgi:hypothetical protein